MVYKAEFTDETKKIISVNGQTALKAANGEGEAILMELVKFAETGSAENIKNLMWLPEQLAWLDIFKNKIVLFSTTKNKRVLNNTYDFVMTYLKQGKEKDAKYFSNPTDGLVTSNEGVILSTDAGAAVQLPKGEKVSK